MVTIKDVAAEAGVAISTVSKVLNGYSGVSDQTKEKVNEAVEKLGFTPNTVAAALSSKKSGRIALLMNLDEAACPMDQINMDYLSGTISSALAYKLDAVTIFFNMIDQMDLETLVGYLKSQSIEGLIIFGITKKHTVLLDLIERKIFKSVVIDAPICNESTTSVWIDNKQAQIDIVLKTLDKVEGNRLLYIAGHKESFVTDYRLQGIAELERILNTKANIQYGDYSELKAREITLRYARQTDLIACGSDLMAIGAMRALMEMDIFKPVCGFDGVKLMAYAGAQMNTVKQDFYHMSETAVGELKKLLDGDEGVNVLEPYSLVRMKYEDVLI